MIHSMGEFYRAGAGWALADPPGGPKKPSVMKNSLRIVLTAVCVATLAAGVLPARAQTPALIPVTFAIIAPNASEWPVLIAKQQGFFRDEGLDVSIVSANTPPNVMNAVATNAANLGDTGSDTAIAAIVHGLAVKIVAPIFTVNPFALVVPPSIKSWTDLRGKQVVLASKQDVTAMSFAAMAAKNHATMDDFSITLSGDSSARYAALASGNVQGAMLAQPFDLEAEAHGMHALDTSFATMKDWMFKSVFVNTAWAEANRATTVKVLRALRSAIRFGYAQREPTVAILIDATHAGATIVQSTYDLDFVTWHAFDPNLKMNERGLLNVAQAQVAFGVLTTLPKLGDIYDPSFVAAIAR
jgi:NitT/TauT family transport system substrate-binding protein